MFWKRRKQPTFKVPMIEIPESQLTFANDFLKKKRLDEEKAGQLAATFDGLPVTEESIYAVNQWWFISGYVLGLEHSLSNLHLLEKEDEQD